MIRSSLEETRLNVLNLAENHMVELTGEEVSADPKRRLRLAVAAVAARNDIEKVCRHLTWSEFEEIVTEVFTAKNYQVKKHFLFKHDGRRFEIDLIVLIPPIVFCIDCKHWRKHLHRGRTTRAVEAQQNRVKALAEAVMSGQTKLWPEYLGKTKFVPLILSLADVAYRIIDGTPVVPVLRLKSFLEECTPILPHGIRSIGFDPSENVDRLRSPKTGFPFFREGRKPLL